jgi:uncharacterized membrane protein
VPAPGEPEAELSPRTPEGAPEPDAPSPPERERETIGGLFERFVAGNLLIWIGGIALAVAGVLIIRFSIGLITPEVRMIAAALLGLVLIGAGEYARAGRWADDPRVAQALVGAGVAILYAAAYGTHILYDLIGTRTVAAAMVAITAAALVLALRHGAPAAVLGLIGGFLTPALVGRPGASVVPLLAYLALLDLAIFLLARRRSASASCGASTSCSARRGTRSPAGCSSSCSRSRRPRRRSARRARSP